MSKPGGMPAQLAAAIAAHREQLAPIAAGLGPYARQMHAACAYTSLPCPTCGAPAGYWCTSRRHNQTGTRGYHNSAVRHQARHRLVAAWPEESKILACLTAGVYRKILT